MHDGFDKDTLFLLENLVGSGRITKVCGDWIGWHSVADLQKFQMTKNSNMTVALWSAQSNTSQLSTAVSYELGILFWADAHTVISTTDYHAISGD